MKQMHRSSEYCMLFLYTAMCYEYNCIKKYIIQRVVTDALPTWCANKKQSPRKKCCTCIESHGSMDLSQTFRFSM